MKPEDIAAFVRANIEPLPRAGPRYSVAAKLTDGTSLPCVVVESVTHVVDLAMRRFEEERLREIKSNSGLTGGYRKIVEAFVAAGNRVNYYEIESLQKSDFAIPLARLGEIKGETSMGWTEFYGTMKDGAEFRFGTTFHEEFFEMPQGYSATDIQMIVPAVRSEEPRYEKVFREKPFFICYIEGL